MYYELLALEIHATAAGLEVLKPPTLVGRSGITHKFSFMAKDDNLNYGFDIYNDVTREEVIRTFAKKLDTKAYAFIVSLRGRPKQEVISLADEYGITVLGPADIDTFFNWMKVEATNPRESLGISP